MQLDSMTIILLAVIAVLLLVLHIVCGVVAGHIAGRKGRSERGYFWLGFFLGLIGLVIAEIRRPATFIWNPNLKKELMYITFLHQCGSLTDKEFEQEKKVIQWMNDYM